MVRALTIQRAVAAILLIALGVPVCAQSIAGKRVPIIDVTDLYLPASDWGDNFDLLTAYGLPEVDLKAIILDITQAERKAWPRDPGTAAVEQLNYIFDRNVPYGVGPFEKMRSLDDQMLDSPAYQQQGIQLLLKTLRESQVPVVILSFGSLRPIAVAYNRDPALFHAKVAAIHISAGTAYLDLKSVPIVDHPCVCDGPNFNREWNVDLDPLAFIRMLRSDLPIVLYPCARRDGADKLDPHDSYWRMPNLEFVHELDQELQRYLGFVFGDAHRLDYLRAIDFGLSDAESAAADRAFKQPHNVWETAVWMAVSNRRLARHADGSYEIVPAQSVNSADLVLANELIPCHVEVRDDANFVCKPTSDSTNFRIYERGDPKVNQAAFQEALPKLYKSYLVPARHGQAAITQP
jgi:hypothetical protein